MLVAQSCLTLCDPIDCSLPGSSVHGISQARILEWVAIPFSRASSQLRDPTLVSHFAGTAADSLRLSRQGSTLSRYQLFTSQSESFSDFSLHFMSKERETTQVGELSQKI